MEVKTETEFNNLAKKYIYSYVYARKDVFKTKDDINLKNTIAMSFGHEIIPPKNEKESKLADEGRYFMFSEEAEKHVQITFDAIKRFSLETVKIKIIPLAVYYNNKMYSFPLFVILTSDGKKYVDNYGRVYKNYDDWNANNCLPAGRVAFPKYFRMDDNLMITFMKTPENTSKIKVWKHFDIILKYMGIGVNVCLFFGCVVPGSQLIMIGILGYGICRSTLSLIDRKTHGQSIIPLDPTARSHWLNIAASGVSLISIGVLYRVSNMAAKGAKLSNSACTITNVVNGLNLGLSGAIVLNDSIYVLSNWSDIPLSQKFFIFAHIAFFAQNAMSFKTADQLIADFREKAINNIIKDKSTESIQKVNEYRSQFGDQKFIKLYNKKLQVPGMTHELAINSIVSEIKLISDVKSKTSNTSANTSVNIEKFSDTVKVNSLSILIGSVATTGLQKLLEKLIEKVIEKLTDNDKNGILNCIYPILANFPVSVLEYVINVVDRINYLFENNDFIIACMKILGLILNFFWTTKYEYDECGENFNSTCSQLGITDNTNINKKIWKDVLEKFNDTSVTDLYNLITNFRAVDNMIGAMPIRKNLTNDLLIIESENMTNEELVSIIEHCNIRFGSEPAAIFHFITEGLDKYETSLENYFEDANNFVCKKNFKEYKIKNGYRFFYYEQFVDKSLNKYAVVSEYNGYISLCTFKIYPKEQHSECIHSIM